ncbi:class I tRNA ligase family protein [endosymbiont of Metamasius hemipterus]|uniref:Class I tRNA ligase family protein n=1 Tax=endosymbiont of Metamasius hemipterus TaxID=204627 RepID=A0ABT0TWA0_9GAMM|nr:class I tRNA ligase family protein [endosymbiont of Metamasius hemipterus]
MLQYVIIDFFIRFNKMQYNINFLLQFGFDHAGIATQLLIENNNLNEKNNNNLIKESFK